MKVLITGTTGMVGEGVLQVCLHHSAIDEVIIVNRRSAGMKHPKLQELIVPDLFDLSSVESHLHNIDACYFCLGITSVGISQEAYEKTTFDLTLSIAQFLVTRNPQMTFCYISGQGTDSSEKGRSHWARVKGKTENELRKLPFKQVFAYRPGFIKPMHGLQHTKSFYKYINWLYPIGRLLYPNGFNALQEIGMSMISVTQFGCDEFILNGKQITSTANRTS